MDRDTKRILVMSGVGLVAVIVVLMITLNSSHTDFYGPQSARASTETVTPSTKRRHSGMGGSAGGSSSSTDTTGSIIQELEDQSAAPVGPKLQKFSKKTRRAKSADLAIIQFEEGEEAGRIALRTSREWRIFREWQHRIEAQGGGTTLFFDGEVDENHRTYKLAIDGATVDGTIEVIFDEGVWKVIAVNSAEDDENDPLNFWRELIDTDESMYDEE